jgi:hypothetical protein
MASAIRQMTGVGGDVRKIARLLQKKAPPGHMLAYINQEEADLLKARGGSGEPHADTGVPSFEEEYVPDYSPTSVETIGPSTELKSSSVAPLEVSSSSPFAAYERATLPDTARYFQENQAAGAAPKVDLGQGAFASFGDFASAPSGSTYTDENISGSLRDSAARAAAAPTSAEGATPFTATAGATKPDFYAESRALNAGTPTEKGFFEGMTPETKARLGIGGLQAVIGAYQTQQAAEQGRKAREEIQRLAQPYQDQGKKLIAQAQSGELSPAAQQTLQAAQAQAAQGAQARGGVGAQQAMAQVEALRQQLLQNQYDYGLKVSGIGDNIATGAIKTGLEADRYVNQLTNSYFTNIARTAYGQAPQVAGSPTYVREA